MQDWGLRNDYGTATQDWSRTESSGDGDFIRTKASSNGSIAKSGLAVAREARELETRISEQITTDPEDILRGRIVPKPEASDSDCPAENEACKLYAQLKGLAEQEELGAAEQKQLQEIEARLPKLFAEMRKFYYAKRLDDMRDVRRSIMNAADATTELKGIIASDKEPGPETNHRHQLAFQLGRLNKQISKFEKIAKEGQVVIKPEDVALANRIRSDALAVVAEWKQTRAAEILSDLYEEVIALSKTTRRKEAEQAVTWIEELRAQYDQELRSRRTGVAIARPDFNTREIIHQARLARKSIDDPSLLPPEKQIDDVVRTEEIAKIPSRIDRIKIEIANKVKNAGMNLSADESLLAKPDSQLKPKEIVSREMARVDLLISEVKEAADELKLAEETLEGVTPVDTEPHESRIDHDMETRFAIAEAEQNLERVAQTNLMLAKDARQQVVAAIAEAKAKVDYIPQEPIARIPSDEELLTPIVPKRPGELIPQEEAVALMAPIVTRARQAASEFLQGVEPVLYPRDNTLNSRMQRAAALVAKIGEVFDSIRNKDQATVSTISTTVGWLQEILDADPKEVAQAKNIDDSKAVHNSTKAAVTRAREACAGFDLNNPADGSLEASLAAELDSLVSLNAKAFANSQSGDDIVHSAEYASGVDHAESTITRLIGEAFPVPVAADLPDGNLADLANSTFDEKFGARMDHQVSENAKKLGLDGDEMVRLKRILSQRVRKFGSEDRTAQGVYLKLMSAINDDSTLLAKVTNIAEEARELAARIGIEEAAENHPWEEGRWLHQINEALEKVRNAGDNETFAPSWVELPLERLAWLRNAVEANSDRSYDAEAEPIPVVEKAEEQPVVEQPVQIRESNTDQLAELQQEARDLVVDSPVETAKPDSKAKTDTVSGLYSRAAAVYQRIMTAVPGDEAEALVYDDSGRASTVQNRSVLSTANSDMATLVDLLDQIANLQGSRVEPAKQLLVELKPIVQEVNQAVSQAGTAGMPLDISNPADIDSPANRSLEAEIADKVNQLRKLQGNIASVVAGESAQELPAAFYRTRMGELRDQSLDLIDQWKLSHGGRESLYTEEQMNDLHELGRLGRILNRAPDEDGALAGAKKGFATIVEQAKEAAQNGDQSTYESKLKAARSILVKNGVMRSVSDSSKEATELEKQAAFYGSASAVNITQSGAPQTLNEEATARILSLRQDFKDDPHEGPEPVVVKSAQAIPRLEAVLIKAKDFSPQAAPNAAADIRTEEGRASRSRFLLKQIQRIAPKLISGAKVTGQVNTRELIEVENNLREIELLNEVKEDGLVRTGYVPQQSTTHTLSPLDEVNGYPRSLLAGARELLKQGFGFDQRDQVAKVQDTEEAVAVFDELNSALSANRKEDARVAYDWLQELATERKAQVPAELEQEARSLLTRAFGTAAEASAPKTDQARSAFASYRSLRNALQTANPVRTAEIAMDSLRDTLVNKPKREQEKRAREQKLDEALAVHRKKLWARTSEKTTDTESTITDASRVDEVESPPQKERFGQKLKRWLRINRG